MVEINALVFLVLASLFVINCPAESNNLNLIKRIDSERSVASEKQLFAAHKGRKLLQGAGADTAGAGVDPTGQAAGDGGAGALLMAGSGVKTGGTDAKGAAGTGTNDGTLQQGTSASNMGQPPSPPVDPNTAKIQATLRAMGFGVISEPERVPAPNNFNVKPNFDEGVTKAEYDAMVSQQVIFSNGSYNTGPAAPPKNKRGMDSRLITDLSGNVIDTNVLVQDNVAPGPQLVWLQGSQVNGG